MVRVPLAFSIQISAFPNFFFFLEDASRTHLENAILFLFHQGLFGVCRLVWNDLKYLFLVKQNLDFLGDVAICLVCCRTGDWPRGKQSETASTSINLDKLTHTSQTLFHLSTVPSRHNSAVRDFVYTRRLINSDQLTHTPQPLCFVLTGDLPLGKHSAACSFVDTTRVVVMQIKLFYEQYVGKILLSSNILPAL